MQQPYHLTVSKAADFADVKERRLYRFFEIFPGLLAWGAIFVAFIASFLFPMQVAMFIIAFILYWFFRNLYFLFHLRAGYVQMNKNRKKDWVAELDRVASCHKDLSITGWRDIYHLIVIPTYKEDKKIIRDAIQALAENDYPKERMIVVIGIEKKEGETGREKADELLKEFEHTFYRMVATYHPANREGEIAGKGSNETWALRHAVSEIIDQEHIPYERIIVTSLDADTRVYPKYFSCLTHYYVTSPDPLHRSFQPIPLFLNNIWEASAVSRIFSFSITFWYTINQERAEKLVTFSSHSMGLKQLIDVNYKQTNVISDDSRIFWQCFLFYDGNYKTQPLYYPISMDANVAPSFMRTLRQIYKQQRRWAYGAAEIPYVLFGFYKNKKIPFLKKATFAAELIEIHWSWATAPILIFFLGWLPIYLGGGEFSQSLISYNLPRFTSIILTVSMIGLLSSVYLGFVLLPARPEGFRKRRIIALIFQWALMPVSMIFLSLPALEAQTRLMLGKYLGFWVTPKFRKNEE